jgi:hypothetical protein
MQDMTEAERLVAYQQTRESQDFQREMAEWEDQQKALQQAAEDQQRQAFSSFLKEEREIVSIDQKKDVNDFIKAGFSNDYSPIVGITASAYSGYGLSQFHLDQLKSGYISVSSNVLPKTRNVYKATVIDSGFEFYGTRYLPQSVAKITAKGLISNSINGEAWFVAGGTSLISNSVEYGWGATNINEFFDRTVENQDFWASTAADTVVGVATGLLAAAVVAGVIVGLTSVGVVAAATAPLWLVVGATAVVGAAIGVGLSALGVNQWVQNIFNTGIDTVHSWFQ